MSGPRSGYWTVIFCPPVCLATAKRSARKGGGATAFAKMSLFLISMESSLRCISHGVESDVFDASKWTPGRKWVLCVVALCLGKFKGSVRRKHMHSSSNGASLAPGQ